MGTQQCDPGADAGRVFALFGPTGVGKSEAAVALGERIQDEGGAAVIIAADSMQVYSGLSRLSGAASADLQARVPHRLLGVVPVTETFSVGQYSPLAHQEIDGALERGVVPIVVGGTGLYLQAALTEMPLRPPLDPETIAAVESRLEVDGEKALRSELLNRSPAAAARISSGDHRRLVRALALLDEGHNLEDQAGGI
ncbi:MAG: tRNA (adenosine(37)-N6)-dimethylallyltransferase MiaA, partial [Actinobacteria bacterium]|nr:tRNA (adenosine(37)-N6)-dimethylallyltransferase MiaA [Actinomycetota bacterium]